MSTLGSQIGLLWKILIVFSCISDSICTIYKSVTSLDEYGTSPQINYARLASKLHSAPTIVAIAGSNVITVYMDQNKIGVLPRNKVNILGEFEGNVLATVGSGISADIAYINRLLRKDIMNSWERYDSFPDCERVSHITNRIMLAFMNYGDDMIDGSVDILNDEHGERLNIGRPFGANIAVLHLCSSGKINFQVIEPSGVISSRHAFCFGIGSDTGNHLLNQKLQQEMTADETRDLCLDILSDILFRYNFISASNFDNKVILVESLDSCGAIHVERFAIQDIKQKKYKK